MTYKIVTIKQEISPTGKTTFEFDPRFYEGGHVIHPQNVTVQIQGNYRYITFTIKIKDQDEYTNDE